MNYGLGEQAAHPRDLWEKEFFPAIKNEIEAIKV